MTLISFKNPKIYYYEEGKMQKKNVDKGQLISKPIHDLLTSPKKRTNEFDLFAAKSKKANKSNSSVRFFGEVSRS